MSKKALGRGLNSLIPDTYEKNKSMIKQNDHSSSEFSSSKGFFEVETKKLIPNQDQPRFVFDDEKMVELISSVREKGIIQPIIVKKHEYDGQYEIICGERRFRAAQEVGLQKVPVVIKDVSATDLLEVALIENIQREDLNPIEEAEAYLKLYERGLSHEVIAQKVGKNRTTVVNLLRLLKLPKDVLKLLLENQITEGHARTLLSLPSEEYQMRLAKRVIDEKLSVRQLEDLVKRKAYQKRPAKRLRSLDSQIVDLERKMEDRFGSKVRVFAGKNKGRIEIKYFSLSELDRILAVVGVKVD
jgi:ParB family chromosome partitioning protein